MGECTNPIEEGFAEPTVGKLSNLGPGCFVQKTDEYGSCCWVELTSWGDNGNFEAVAHPALTRGADKEGIVEGDKVTVQRGQITALGCDRFCFC